MEAERFRRPAGGGHDVDLASAVALADKGDLFSIRREARLAVAAGVLRQGTGLPAVDGDGPDVAVPLEGEGGAVGRQGGTVGEADGFAAVCGGCQQQANWNEPTKVLQHALSSEAGD